MATSIIENLTILQIFGFFGGPEKKILDFIEIENCFVNKKVANCGFMSISGVLLNSTKTF